MSSDKFRRKFVAMIQSLKSVYLMLALLVLPILVLAEFVNIGVMGHYNFQRFSFTVEKGNYKLFADNKKIDDLKEGDILFLIQSEGKVEVKSTTQRYGHFNRVYLIGKELENEFRVTPIVPEKNIRAYQDNLKVSSTGTKLVLVNNIDIENYISGVVQAEVGPHPAPEFFKLQSILCRTYALDNLNKHEHEGFNLCDRVHCQAYYKKCTQKEIRQATLATKGLVIVDSDIKLITAAFYSNCGGQTVNSEDVWQKPVYYLRSVKDPHCVNEPNAKWSKKIPKEQWVDYLHRKSRIQNGNSQVEMLAFYQGERKSYFEHGNAKIPLKNIRKDWKLKSTYFSAVPNGEYVYLEGRGFGHGTGLCQEGAMRMAASGYSYPDILHFYYKNVHLVDLSALDFFRDEQ